MNWGDSSDVGLALLEKFPDRDPLTVCFTELHEMVLDLEGFVDPAGKSNEAKLEAIQMAWYEEWKDQGR